MSWHLNDDRPVYTRNPPPRWWGLDSARHHWTTMPFTREDREGLMRLAVHEAAHAVLSLDCGITVLELTLSDPREASQPGVPAGTTVRAGYSAPYAIAACIMAAGERAQDRWLRERGWWTPDRAWTAERDALHDREEVERMVRQVFRADLTYGLNPSHHTDYACVTSWADEELDSVWPGVLAVAEELVKRRRLTGAEAEAVLKSAKKFPSAAS